MDKPMDVEIMYPQMWLTKLSLMCYFVQPN